MRCNAADAFYENFMNRKKSDQFTEESAREGWRAEEIYDEASQIDQDDIQRQINRGDESKGNPNERDTAGSVDKNETAQGREEAKNDLKNKANANG